MSPYHFTECGLPNVILLNGFNLDAEDTVSFTDLDGLHHTLGYELARPDNPRALTGDELKYLLGELDFSPEYLAIAFDVPPKTARSWADGKLMPYVAEVLLRLLYLQEKHREKHIPTVLRFMEIFRFRDIPLTQDILLKPTQYIFRYSITGGWVKTENPNP